MVDVVYGRRKGRRAENAHEAEGADLGPDAALPVSGERLVAARGGQRGLQLGALRLREVLVLGRWQPGGLPPRGGPRQHRQQCQRPAPQPLVQLRRPLDQR